MYILVTRPRLTSRIWQHHQVTAHLRSSKELIKHVWMNGWKPLQNIRLIKNLGDMMSSVRSILNHFQSNLMRHIDHEPLTVNDYQNIKMFDVLICSDLSARTYNLICQRFTQELKLHSLYQVHSWIARLSHVPEHCYDCCSNTCCCYIGSLTDLNA